MQSAVASRELLEARQGEASDLRIMIELLHMSAPAVDGCPHQSRNVAFLSELWSLKGLLAWYVPPLRFFKLHDEGPNSTSLVAITQRERMLEETASSILGCHIGLPLGDSLASSTRAAARARVYNLSLYRAGTAYGPFLPAPSLAEAGQRVDWLHLEAIMTVALSNTSELYQREVGPGRALPITDSIERP